MLVKFHIAMFAVSDEKACVRKIKAKTKEIYSHIPEWTPSIRERITVKFSKVDVLFHPPRLCHEMRCRQKNKHGKDDMGACRGIMVNCSGHIRGKSLHVGTRRRRSECPITQFSISSTITHQISPLQIHRQSTVTSIQWFWRTNSKKDWKSISPQ
jgi:hypothetical protein